ncbi:alpha/beta fold hydrolase [Gryllotalpicola ginsengisoli]|uniref:alpha/beta fold hydrolase n=1 Tax=Gryllotalpicola ginsengisoli TaxID=444608 RepID=UPI0003B68627|nr:alpha/beta hydrolase [Gryllotalpicola ginsengisoli]
MARATSADGTGIAFDSVGDGAAVVIVNGAFSTAADAAEFAAELALAGFRAVTFDRRARAGSGDTSPYAPEREAEDLAAVIAAAGGTAGVVGHSSGAVLALFAASLGVPTGHLFLSEPPFRFGEGEPPADLPERMQALIDEGRPDEAVVAFQLEAVGMPQPVIDQVRASPMFASLVALAQSAVYDATLARAVSTPTDAMLAVAAPVTVVSGAETIPFLRVSAERLAGLIAGAEFVEVPESVGHRLDPAATTRVIAERLPS